MNALSKSLANPSGSVFTRHLVPRNDDYAVSDVDGFVGRDADTLMRLANDNAVLGQPIQFEYEGHAFTALLMEDDFFDDGYSITLSLQDTLTATNHSLCK
tara:strand:+ start:6488 stop:6787 length:300 start_codon:yes stop_codon:yes gene_type:complete